VSIEEVYLRSFVTAGAAAAAVAFLVLGVGFAWRTRLGESGLGIVGGLALAIAWITAHAVMRGPGVWADLMRGGTGWTRALWPIEATDRFHVPIAIAAAGGLIAAAAAGRNGRNRPALRWAVRIVSVGVIAWLAPGPLVESNFAVGVVCGLFGIAWWAALEDAVPAPSGALMPITAAMCGTGFGALMLMRYATTLGLVALCGAAVLCVLAAAGARDPRLTRGPVVPAVVAGGWVALIVSSVVFAQDWPAPAFVCACVAPFAPALFGVPWLRKRPAWNRWVAQLAVAGVLMGFAVGWVWWIDHDLRPVWPF